MKRKITQIITGSDQSLFAICDDGSLWHAFPSALIHPGAAAGPAAWTELPAPPHGPPPSPMGFGSDARNPLEGKEVRTR